MTYIHDADGALVKRETITTTPTATMHISLYTCMTSGWAIFTDVSLEGEGARVTKHYFHGDRRVAVLRNSVPWYRAGEHPSAALTGLSARTGLGSTSVLRNSSGNGMGEVICYYHQWLAENAQIMQLAIRCR